MTDLPEDHPLIAELADARERIEHLEQEVKTLRTQTPAQRERAEQAAEGRRSSRPSSVAATRTSRG